MKHQYLVDYQPESCFYSNLTSHFVPQACKGSSGRLPAETAFRFSLSEEGYSANYFQSIEDIEDTWSQVAPSDNLFLKASFLKVLEFNTKEENRAGYLIFYKGDQPIGCAYLQSFSFTVGNNIRTDHLEKMNDLQKRWYQVKRSATFNWRLNLLICGNMLLSGEHHFHFLPKWSESHMAYRLLNDAMKRASALMTERGHRIDVLMIKDVYNSNEIAGNSLTRLGFAGVDFQPNMVMNIKQEWKDFSDYLGDLTSKYRVRVKRALRKSDSLCRKELDQSEVQQLSGQLYDLYKIVSDSAGFNMVELVPTYIPALKYRFGRDFRVTGYYEGDELIGYSTTLRNGNELEAHFLGMKKESNKHFQLYFNMLLDMLKQGIKEGASKIVFARTALEIKSSVGAEAYPMRCYFKHRNPLINLVTGPMIRSLAPVEKWVPRHPFRKNEESERS